MLSRGHPSDLCDLNLTRDHLVTESSDDPSQKLKSVARLARDENTELDSPV
jgi:hypothetical protein